MSACRRARRAPLRSSRCSRVRVPRDVEVVALTHGRTTRRRCARATRFPPKDKSPSRWRRRLPETSFDSRSLTRGSYRNDRPAITFAAQNDVEIAHFGFAGDLNRPASADVVLLLGAHLLLIQRIEGHRLRFVEQSVEQIRGLVAAEHSALRDETGELKLHLIGVADTGDDRLRAAAAEAAGEVAHGDVEVLELSRCDERGERYRQEHRNSRPESHGLLLCLAVVNAACAV